MLTDLTCAIATAVLAVVGVKFAEDLPQSIAAQIHTQSPALRLVSHLQSSTSIPNPNFGRKMDRGVRQRAPGETTCTDRRRWAMWRP